MKLNFPEEYELSIDTVVLCFPVPQSFRLNLDDGWKTTTDSKGNILYTRKINKINIGFYPINQIILVSFSASGLVNKYNYIKYNVFQYDILKEKVETTLFSATNYPFRIEDAKISRVDIFKHIETPDDEMALGIVDWLKNQPVVGKYTKRIYGTGDYRVFKSGLVMKAYLKNHDPALEESQRKLLKPTVRIEIELKKNFRRKILGKNINAADILTNPTLWWRSWNIVMEKFKLDGTILSNKDLRAKAFTILKYGNQTSRDTTIHKKIDILMNPISKQNRKTKISLINKIAQCGICPYSYEQNHLIKNNTLVADQPIHVSLLKMLALFKKVIAHKKEVKQCDIKKNVTISCSIFTNCSPTVPTYVWDSS